MSDLYKAADRTTSPESTPSRERRRLLKAAAAGAPLIATLPSGAAFANASVRQCVVNAAEKEQVPANGYLYVPAGEDTLYIRAAGVMQTWRRRGAGDKTVIAWPRGNPTKRWSAPTSGNQLDQWDDFDPTGWTHLNPSADKPIDILLLWKVGGQGSGFEPVGMWPDVQQKTGEAFGVTRSCLCSVDPGTEPWCV